MTLQRETGEVYAGLIRRYGVVGEELVAFGTTFTGNQGSWMEVRFDGIDPFNRNISSSSHNVLIFFKEWRVR
jgi:hypothetical protein